MFETEFLDVPALRAVSGTVRLPGSKSISNRVLLLAALCEGQTTVRDLLDSDDTRVMLQALRQLARAWLARLIRRSRSSAWPLAMSFCRSASAC